METMKFTRRAVAVSLTPLLSSVYFQTAARQSSRPGLSIRKPTDATGAAGSAILFNYNRMELYKNMTGKSTIRKYEAGIDYLIVEFEDGTTYKYNMVRPGTKQLNEMIQLARTGSGLDRYINEHVKDNYAVKLR